MSLVSHQEPALRAESRKLSQKYISPFRIARKVNPVSYCLFLCPFQYNESHVSCLIVKTCLVFSLCPPPPHPHRNPPPPTIINGQPAYTVRRILDSRRVQNSLKHLVDWEGYEPEKRSWVPAKDNPSLIREFCTSGAAPRGWGPVSILPPVGCLCASRGPLCSPQPKFFLLCPC